MLKPLFHVGPARTKKLVEEDACSLHNPPPSLLSPSYTVWLGSTKDHSQASAKLVGEVLVCNAKKNFTMVLVNVQIPIAESNPDNIAEFRSWLGTKRIETS